MSKTSGKTHFIIPILFLITLVLASCSASKRAIKSPLKEYGAEYLFENLKNNELKYDYFSARFTAAFSQNKSQTSFSGQLRIHRDSLIWISISPALGIEMVRVMFTNDSVFYMNRLDNTYFKSNFDYINSVINSTLDYDMLQSFLTGNDFSFYEVSSFRAGIENHEYKLITTDRRKLKKYVRNNREISIPLQNIWLDPETFKITRVMIKELVQNGRKLEGKYTYTLNEGQLMPASIRFDLETLENKNSIEVEYSKVGIAEELQFPFRIPDKFRRVSEF